MKLYLIRHGQSEANVKKVFCGHNDLPLTEQGRKDAENCRNIIEGITFDKVYSSDLSRAIETQQIAYPCECVERLAMIREIDVGSLKGMFFADAELDPDIRENWRAWQFRKFGGEDYADVKKRATDFLDLVLKTGCEKVVAFSHGGFIQMVCDVVLETYLVKKHLSCYNCGIFVFEYVNDNWYMRVSNYNGTL